MNVFILCTGRCGSVTFINACKHITNYSSAHESRSSMIGADRLSYPENHIEADNRLSWVLGRLDRTYGDNAIYIHLMRDPEATAASFVKRFNSGIMKAYTGQGIIMGLPRRTNRLDVALDYCDTVNSNIESFLKDKTKKMTVKLETAKTDFPEFCNLINATANLDLALAEFDHSYNASG